MSLGELTSNAIRRLGVESAAVVNLIEVSVVLIAVGLLAWIMAITAKKWLPWVVRKFTGRTKIKWDDDLFDQKFFNRLGTVLVPIVIRIGLSWLEWDDLYILNRFINTWITIACVLLVSSLIDGINRVYEIHSASREHPVKALLQVIKIFMWGAAFMVIIHIFSGKSLVALLGGLTAFTAVLMLIFQDTILGFVAGIQLSANRMVRLGDWIVMPSRGVDGDVIEISLTTVKVQNWDKTITTIPTHKMVSESFTNWRGMQESGGRRIKRSINIDIACIRYLSREDLDNLKKSEFLKVYIEKKIAELEKYNANRESHLDERRLTNIGTFREYLEIWIANHPGVNKNMTHMVRQLQPGPTGLPLEVYCFSDKTAWINYENIQSDLFDHIFAVMPLFGLQFFQYSSNISE